MQFDYCVMTGENFERRRFLTVTMARDWADAYSIVRDMLESGQQYAMVRESNGSHFWRIDDKGSKYLGLVK